MYHHCFFFFSFFFSFLITCVRPPSCYAFAFPPLLLPHTIRLRPASCSPSISHAAFLSIFIPFISHISDRIQYTIHHTTHITSHSTDLYSHGTVTDYGLLASRDSCLQLQPSYQVVLVPQNSQYRSVRM
ncbi:hypothetical protein C8F04DRAFT_1131987 [Mycena alexandri]|uniref:Secreted protein n=1 Tax=Mycena alexandri TaxID=1745969 RepID=A0AAD6SC62_9AGAR|nr:hypothetical protein C8F04DRAFT_1131987 [Mycena alexandri]